MNTKLGGWWHTLKNSHSQSYMILQIKYFISPLATEQLPQNMTRSQLTVRGFHKFTKPFKHQVM